MKAILKFKEKIFEIQKEMNPILEMQQMTRKLSVDYDQNNEDGQQTYVESLMNIIIKDKELREIIK